MTMPRLSNPDARRLFLARHGLCGGPSDTMALIDQLGFVQVDSINMVERAHHMILSARMKRYRPRDLIRLLERDRQLFEHWTHDAAVIPVAFFPYWRLRFARDRQDLMAKWKNWRRDGFAEKFDAVLERVRDHGPVMARDVGEDEQRSSGGWWDWHPSKTALEFLWRTGQLAVCRREGFQKVFDLTERVIPEPYLSRDLPEAEIVEWAAASALDRLGFATSGEIAAFWEAISPAEAKAWCQRHLERELIEIEILQADGTPRRVYARPDVEDAAATAPPPPGGMRVLSPFDPALRDRKRAERLFGFHYRIEIFVPAPRRRYGYYVFPLLEGDRLVGRIDMKRDPAEGCLTVRALWPEFGVRWGKGRQARLEAELARVARVAGCSDPRFADGWLRQPL
ncbi:MAG: crosslink repair DNA glycosylase YcaQ family protein [Pseudomonadota bacterium]